MTSSDFDGLLLVSEAARRLCLSPQRLRTLADEGRIACVRTQFGRLFDPVEVERFGRSRGHFGRYGEVPSEGTGSDGEPGSEDSGRPALPKGSNRPA